MWTTGDSLKQRDLHADRMRVLIMGNPVDKLEADLTVHPVGKVLDLTFIRDLLDFDRSVQSAKSLDDGEPTVMFAPRRCDEVGVPRSAHIQLRAESRSRPRNNLATYNLITGLCRSASQAGVSVRSVPSTLKSRPAGRILSGCRSKPRPSSRLRACRGRDSGLRRECCSDLRFPANAENGGRDDEGSVATGDDS